MDPVSNKAEDENQWTTRRSALTSYAVQSCRCTGRCRFGPPSGLNPSIPFNIAFAFLVDVYGHGRPSAGLLSQACSLRLCIGVWSALQSLAASEGSCCRCSCFHEYHLQIPEGTQRGGDSLWLPFPEGQLRSSQTPTLQTAAFQTGTMIKRTLLHH